MTEEFKKFKQGFLDFLKDYHVSLTEDQKKTLIRAASANTGLEKEDTIVQQIRTLKIEPKELAAQYFIKNVLKGGYQTKGYFWIEGQRIGMYVYPQPGHVSRRDLEYIVHWFNPYAEKISIGSTKLVWDAPGRRFMEYPVTVLF